ELRQRRVVLQDAVEAGERQIAETTGLGLELDVGGGEVRFGRSPNLTDDRRIDLESHAEPDPGVERNLIRLLLEISAGQRGVDVARALEVLEGAGDEDPASVDEVGRQQRVLLGPGR